MQDSFSLRGFLPAADPLAQFSAGSEFRLLDDVGRDLPSRLLQPDFRAYVESLVIPRWPDNLLPVDNLPELRLYFVRLAFLASAYINQLGQPSSHCLPANIAVPLVRVARLLGVSPILNYAAYALYNWRRFDAAGGIELGNIDTIQNFVHLYDEHWFILVHVEIEARAARLLASVQRLLRQWIKNGELSGELVNDCLGDMAESLGRQLQVLQRIPEHMSPALYFHRFRPYIRSFDNVEYRGLNSSDLAELGVKGLRINYRGETGAQSSIMPTLMSLLKIKHQPSVLVNHLQELRCYMPLSHRQFIARVAGLPDIKSLAAPELFDEVLEQMALFREVHFNWALEYINKHVEDPRGTGGTPYMQWLQQLIDETRQAKHATG